VSEIAKKSDLALFMAKAYYKQIRPRYVRSKYTAPKLTIAAVYNLYDMANPDARRVWEGLDYVLREFRRSVVDDGAQFAIAFSTPDDFPWIDPPPPANQTPSTMVPDMMRAWFLAFGARTGTPVHDLGAEIAGYIVQHKLNPPYLSYTCDPHYNPEGQRVIAESLLDFLKSRDLLPASASSQ
jgi:hypothetical protein